jgi:hypothetical protein
MVSFWAHGDGEESYRRIWGCIILGLMPPEGLEEAVDSLREILEFRLENARLAQAQDRTNVHYGLGPVVSVSQRPDLVLAD